MYHTAILFPPDRGHAPGPALASPAPTCRLADDMPAERGIDVGRRYPLLGLALASGISAICWAGLAALVL